MVWNFFLKNKFPEIFKKKLGPGDIEGHVGKDGRFQLKKANYWSNNLALSGFAEKELS